MKKFLFVIIGFISPLIVTIAYFAIAVEPHMNGDLGHLGFMPFDDNYEASYPNECMVGRHTVIRNADEIKDTASILFVGDSFSRFQSFYGRANYVNMFATLRPYVQIYNMNIDNATDNLVQVAIDILLHNEVLPKQIIVEIVERNLTTGFTQIQFDSPDAISTVMTKVNYEISEKINNEHDKTSWHVKFSKTLENYQQYIKKRIGFKNAVKSARLNREMFTCRGDEDMLYFYQDDIIAQNNEESVSQTKKNIIKVHQLAESKGVELLVFVPSDKFALYRPWLVCDNYNTKSALDYFDDFGEHYFINTRMILRRHLAEGVKDLYLCNDSHWGPEAAFLGANEINKRLSR